MLIIVFVHVQILVHSTHEIGPPLTYVLVLYQSQIDMLGSNGKLGWNVRYKIALGIADGLMYLHNGCQRRIIHRDIKAANILLTRDFEPQVCHKFECNF